VDLVIDPPESLVDTPPRLAVADTSPGAMAEALMARRRKYQGGGDDRLVTFPEAGHFLRPPVTPTTVAQNVARVGRHA
jgi:bile acid acyltransferase/acyl-CoA thioester hydrolase-like protein